MLKNLYTHKSRWLDLLDADIINCNCFIAKLFLNGTKTHLFF